MAVIDLGEKVILSRELKNHTWSLLKNKKALLFDKKNKSFQSLDVVRGMSFVKFYISSLNKMRIEDAKKYRKRIQVLKGQIRELKKKNRELKKRKVITVQARLIK